MYLKHWFQKQSRRFLLHILWCANRVFLSKLCCVSHLKLVCNRSDICKHFVGVNFIPSEQVWDELLGKLWCDTAFSVKRTVLEMKVGEGTIQR